MNHAATFRALHHQPQPLKLANAWDAVSARLFEDLGAQAIATTSAGVSWTLGYPDGDVLPLAMLANVARNIVRVIRIPLSVDFEGGYSEDPNQAGENIKPILDAGAVGINLEDGVGSPELLAAKIGKIREAASKFGVELFINARTDVYLRELVPPDQRVAETCLRSARYRAAGADGLFVPYLVKRDDIAAIAKEAGLPLNLLVSPGLPKADELGELGVRRLSAGSSILATVLSQAAALARNFIETGDFASLVENPLPYSKLQGLFGPRAD